jgi:DNA-binding beta-propeller fold protein YncE
MTIRTGRLLLALPALLLLLAACAAGPTAVREESEGGTRVWPAPPLDTKIVWIKEIHHYRDAEIGKGFWKRVWALVAGENETHIVKPYGVYQDPMKRLFIADTEGGVVHLMDTGNDRYTVIPTQDNVTFHSPIAVTGDSEDNIFITDARAGIVWLYSIQNNALQQFTSFKLGRPTGIAYNRSKRLLYVSDTSANQIVAISADGKEQFRFGSRGTGKGQFNSPTDLFIDILGRVFVTDSLNARIQIFSPEGDFISGFGQAGDAPNEFSKPKGVAVDSDGHVYVCDALRDAIQVFDDDGRLLLTFGERGSEPGEFWMPSGIYIDGDNYIYVSDTYNQRIQIFRYLKDKYSIKNITPAGAHP